MRSGLGCCPVPGCPALVAGGRCPAHALKGWGPRPAMGPGWGGLRARVLAEEPTCRVCGGEPSVSVDHIRARAFGGSDERANLQGIGARCKRLKDLADRTTGKRRAAALRRASAQ